MILHYLLLALRQLYKHKLNTFISVLGLTLGLTASGIILLINHGELTKDSFWPDAERIFFVELEGSPSNSDAYYTHLQPELRDQLVTEFGEILDAARYFWRSAPIHRPLADGSLESSEHHFLEIDPELLDILKFEVLSGDLQEFYSHTDTIVLNDFTARQLFGDDNPIGQRLSVDTRDLVPPGSQAVTQGLKDFRVIAVIAHRRHNSQILDHLFIPYQASLQPQGEPESIQFSARTLIKLKSKSSLSLLENALPDFINKTFPEQMRNQQVPSEFSRYRLVNIADANLHPKTAKGARERIWILYFLAGLILSMACINTLNISLASYTQRQREVALRKTLGAASYQLTLQFWIQEALLVLSAFGLTLILMEQLIPWLSREFELNLFKPLLYSFGFLGQLFVLLLALSLLLGIYPGLLLSRLNPGRFLHANRASETQGSLRIRQLLLVGQFGLSAGLFVAAILISAQLWTIQHKDTGYQSRDILFAHHPRFQQLETGQYNELRTRIAELPGVEFVANTMPGIPGESGEIRKISRADQSLAHAVDLNQAILLDPDQLELFNVSLLAGRYPQLAIPTFAEADPSTSTQNSVAEILLDPAALEQLGYSSAADAVNQELKGYFNNDENLFMTYRIIGVTHDLHLGDTDLPHKPSFFWLMNNQRTLISLGVRYQDEAGSKIREQVEELFQQLVGVKPHIWLVEDSLDNKLRNERMIAKFVYAFSGLAIFISLLGLYGLASLSARQRTREIALRKLHGASTLKILALLARHFSGLVIIANLIAWPISLYAMQQWLINFSQPVSVYWWGGLAGLMSLGLSLLLVWLILGTQALLVARSRPAEVLRED